MRNTLFTGDNLHFLKRLDSASVDLVYLDPPFNSKRVHSAPTGSKAEGIGFKDSWTWLDVEGEFLESLMASQSTLADFICCIQGLHSEAMASYIAYMAQRVIQLHRILKDTGSIYFHCDPAASPYIRGILDGVFGQKNFLNEIVWHYQTGGAGKRWFSRKHDVILLYVKSDSHVFNAEATEVPRTRKSLERSRNPAGARISAGDTSKTAMDVWTDLQALNPMSRERTGYPTQKPLALLHRIIKASSNKGDIVLDPFCGSGTTCVASQQLLRRWISIDIEERSAHMLADRLGGGKKLFRHIHELPERTGR